MIIWLFIKLADGIGFWMLAIVEVSEAILANDNYPKWWDDQDIIPSWA